MISVKSGSKINLGKENIELGDSYNIYALFKQAVGFVQAALKNSFRQGILMTF